jgi:hypothetical protein
VRTFAELERRTCRSEIFQHSQAGNVAQLGFYIVSGSEEPGWSAEFAKISDAMRREVQPIVKAVEQIVRDARLAKASCGPRCLSCSG